MSNSSCYICVALTAPTVEEQVAQLTAATSSGATAVEIQLDSIKVLNIETDLAKILDACTVPAIVSYRSVAEGGSGDASIQLAVLKAAYKAGADFVEVGVKAAPELVQSRSGGLIEKVARATGFTSLATRIIAATYFLDSTPSLELLLEASKAAKGTGADIIKLVTCANDISDNKRLFDLLQGAELPTIAVALKARGELSRVMAAKYGAFLTYAFLPEQAELPTVHDLAHVYAAGRFNKDTKVFGVIGNPISQSRGYLLYNAAMIHAGFNGVYLPLLVDDVKLFFDTFTDFAGFSVTAPHKQWAIKCVDKNDPAALAIGAISAIFREADGSMTGYNMDWGAAIYAVEEGLRKHEKLPAGGKSPLEGRLMVLVGAGGAGRGLAYGVKLLGGELLVADLDATRSQEVATTFGGATVTLDELRKEGAALAIQKKHFPHLTKGPVMCHATPVGMKPNVNATPFEKEALGGWSVVFDAVYNPAETRLQREAASAGATPVSGVEMFLREAEEQFTLFTSGIPAPGAIMREVLVQNLAS